MHWPRRGQRAVPEGKMPGPAGLEPICRKAAALLIEEQRTQDGRTLHSAPRVKLNWDDSDKHHMRRGAPFTSGTARLPRSTIGIFAGHGYRTSSPVTARPMIMR
jgi:hypothetical protein